MTPGIKCNIDEGASFVAKLVRVFVARLSPSHAPSPSNAFTDSNVDL